jgi:TPR repeat protein
MKANRSACVFLFLFLILALQGWGQGKDVTSTKKTSGTAATNNYAPASNNKSGKDYKVTDPKTGTTLTLHFDSVPSESEIEKKFSEYYLKKFNETKARAERGDAKAQYNLGVCYKNGEGVAKDKVEAVKWYRKAAEQGSIAAQFGLGFMYQEGEGVPKNGVEAIKWYRMAAEQGNLGAECNLAAMYNNGDGVPQDYQEAAKWYRKAAEQYGDPGAQCALGMLYEKTHYVKGQGVISPDYAEAVKWYRKAAEQDWPVAQFAQNNLGAMYAKGQGVPQDYAEAVKWYRKAAEQGNDQAQFNLGTCYAEGNGVTQNEIEAYKWSSLSAAQGNKDAANNRDIIASRMSREEITEGQRRASAFVSRRETTEQQGSSSYNSTSPENPTATGTGFFITDDGYLISNCHVVKDAVQVRLVTSTGIIPAKVMRVDAANDLALLKAEGRSVALPVAASRGVKLGGTVATVGFPNIGLQGFAPKLAKGEIAALSGAGDDARYFQISVPVQPGNSGGALVDEHGNVVGVVSAKLDAATALAFSGALPENVNYAVKSSLLLSFLESVPAVSAKLKEPVTADRKFEEVVKSAQDAAVLVLVY